MTSFISRRAAARLIGVRPSTLRAWADAGVGPVPVRGRYEAPAVRAWLTESAFARTQVEEAGGPPDAVGPKS